MVNKKWKNDLLIQCKGDFIEVKISEGDRLILHTEQTLSNQTCEKIHRMLSRWLEGSDPILILDAGFKLTIVRTE